MHIQIEPRLNGTRHSYNIYLINGQRRFLLQNVTSRRQAEKYASGLSFTITPSWAHVVPVTETEGEDIAASS